MMALLTVRTVNITIVYPNSNAILTQLTTNSGIVGVGASEPLCLRIRLQT